MKCNIFQIGAYTGNDDIHAMLNENINRTAILIEPVPWFFNKLKTNYSNIINPRRIAYENVVINTYDGECDFYCMKDNVQYNYNYDADADWGSELSGLYEHIIKEHQDMFFKECEAKYVKLKLPCTTVRTLLKKYNITQIEYLKIDAEGFDGEILKTWPYDIIKPKYLKFESTHLDGHVNQFSTGRQIETKLLQEGYEFYKIFHRDLIYIHRTN